MKYNDVELVEITPEKWNGKTREMFVWFHESGMVFRRVIIGYTTKGVWIDADGDKFKHCAEIPDEFSMDGDVTEEEVEKYFPNRLEIQNYLENESYIDHNGKILDGPYDYITWFSLGCEYMIKKQIRTLEIKHKEEIERMDREINFLRLYN